MRPAFRWTVLLLLAAVALVGLRLVARPYVRAASLIVRVAGLERQHPAIAAVETVTVVERKDQVPSRFGSLRAKVYTPTLGIQRAVLLTPGVNALGIDEPRLVTFARNLAASGLLVVTPELPDLSRYLITARSTDMIEDAALWLSNRRDLTGRRPIGVMGISFAGGLSTVAAARPSLAGRLAFVFSFGGHANFQRVVRYLCSGVEAAPPAGYGLGKTPAPHDYSLAIVTLDLAHRLVPPDQVEGLRKGILTFLHASHLALFDQKKAGEEFRQAVAEEAAMAEPAKGYLHLVNTRNVPELGPRLLPFIADLGDEPALSPDRSPAPAAPVFLIHGAADNVVPAAETAILAEHLRPHTAVRVLITPLISHAEVDRPATSREVWDLITFWKDMLASR
jgi:pimeloyl-ACP methyl ester carboxylesterase